MATLLAPAAPADPRFDELVAQGLARVPAHAPEWTNHNASDPGITLLELLAYFTDALMYRLQRVGPASRLEFLRLLKGGADPFEHENGRVRPEPAALRKELDAALAELSQIDCAVTPADHEHIAQHALAALPQARGVRVLCVPNTNLEATAAIDPDFRSGADEGHVSVIVFAPVHGSTPTAELQADCLATVRHALEPRRLLSSRLHVVAPRWVHLRLRLWVAARPGVDREQLAAHIARVLRAWKPTGGATRGAWTLGLAEIADDVAATEAVEGVARAVFLDASVHEARLGTDAAAIGVQIGLHSTVGRDSRLGGEAPVVSDRLLRDQGGELVAIAFEPWEVPQLDVHPGDIVWVDTTAYQGLVP